MEGYRKDIAHQAITKAIRTGILKRPTSCAKCRTICKPNAHHENDDQPLNVAWLCNKCHALRHKQLRELIKREDIVKKAVKISRKLVLV